VCFDEDSDRRSRAREFLYISMMSAKFCVKRRKSTLFPSVLIPTKST
jgi:hypothetical protein